MANIKKHLDNIKGALYGKDVRSSIHDGIDAINKEVESTTNRQEHLEDTFDQLVINSGNNNAEIVDARVGENGKSYAKLGDRLDEVDSQLEHNVNKINNLKENKLKHVYGFLGDGSDGDTDRLQEAINDSVGELELPNGEFIITKTIKIPPNVILKGVGCGSSLQGIGYGRSTSLKPSSNFEGDKVIEIDPKNINDTTVYSFGNAIQNLTIDCINIANTEKTVIDIRSLTNSETFHDIRILNYNLCIPIVIGKSQNKVSRVSDGLVFSNIYTLPLTSSNNIINPVLKLEGCNEISFRDCKFQSSSGESIYNSKAVYISAQENSKVAAITFDSCSFTNAEKGVFVESNDTDSEGARWVRINNCTFEGVGYAIWLRGTQSRPVQFCHIGGGNRFITTSQKSITLGSYANNNIIIADERATIDLLTNSKANIVIGGQLSVNNGIDNAYLTRVGSSFSTKPYLTDWQTVTLNNNWVSNTSSRTLFGFRKDNNYNKVILKGYLTGGTFSSSSPAITLGEDYAPERNHLFTVACGQNKVCTVIIMATTGNILFVGGADNTDFVCLDGIEYYLD